TTDGKRLTQSELTTGTWLKKPTTKGYALISPCTAQVLHRLLHVTRQDVITIGVAEALLTLSLLRRGSWVRVPAGSPAERNLDFGFAGLRYPVEKLVIRASQLISALL
ncbi:MAG: hypothetical protein K2Q17_13120, partial [Nitrospiraceae bacterium]|nr:hypothetical protein [Nitrospiraceae bacterium]